MSFVRAEYDYQGKPAAGQLQFRKGTILQIESNTQQNVGWLLGTVANDPSKTRGWFPSTYVHLVQPIMPTHHHHQQAPVVADLLDSTTPAPPSQPAVSRQQSSQGYYLPQPTPGASVFPDIPLTPEAQPRNATSTSSLPWSSTSSPPGVFEAEAWPVNDGSEGFGGAPMGGSFTPGKNSGYGEKMASDEGKDSFSIRVKATPDSNDGAGESKKKKRLFPHIHRPHREKRPVPLAAVSQAPSNTNTTAAAVTPNLDNTSMKEETELRMKDMWSRVRGGKNPQQSNGEGSSSTPAAKSSGNRTTYTTTTTTSTSGGGGGGGFFGGRNNNQPQEQTTTSVTTVQGPAPRGRGERVSERVGSYGVYHAAIGALSGRPDRVVRGAVVAAGGFVAADHMKKKRDNQQ